MNDAHYPQQGGYDGRGAEGRERRDEYQQPSYPQQHHHQQQQQQQQQSQQQAQSPPTSASPFAFAPPPLSSVPGPGSSRPPLLAHHSEPPIGQQYSYYQQKPQPVQHNTYPYPASASMTYRSYSGETERQSPQQQSLTRTPSLSILPPAGSVPSQSSPINGSPFTYQRQTHAAQYGTPTSQQAQSSPRASGLYPPNYYTTPYAQPTSADMPRSLSYPSAYAQSYPSYLPSISAPSSLQQPGAHPALIRHNTMAGPNSFMDMRTGPSLGYSFANRLPLVDRPFKCDECVQSFNRNHDLKRHKRIHLSVKPFGCDKCGKTFSRKDALRRHWLVKGCRGEEGATAPITPMYPMNSQPPALSPPTPPTNVSPTESHQNGFDSASTSFSHSSDHPAHPVLPPRQSSDQSQIIVTPDEMAAQQQQMARTTIGDSNMGPGLEEPLVLTSAMGSAGSASQGSAGSMEDGSGSYFEGVVGLKQDGTALVDSPQGSASPYARFPTSPSNGIHHHPYRRPMAMHSPGRQQASPTTAAPYQNATRKYSPSGLGADSKPIFAMPFTPNGAQYTVQQHEGLLAPPLETSTKMEKQGSADGPPDTWQRWHRPSFPFPAPPGVDYNFDPSSPIDVGAQSYGQ
ncbi:hypothetical protein IAR55_001476 [Kwoniella newhampshirensis]|uniref:C2H2-type domain-containing protein n=1 Tax=Kwoniella newhampshirensis TaxID=1651941 RepID=A0AAW0Z285_9TREE